jgi:hypothetical protein
LWNSRSPRLQRALSGVRCGYSEVMQADAPCGSLPLWLSQVLVPAKGRGGTNPLPYWPGRCRSSVANVPPTTEVSRMSKLNLLACSCMLALVVLTEPAFAQYMYLDANGDGINTAAECLSAEGPTIMLAHSPAHRCSKVFPRVPSASRNEALRAGREAV